MLDVALRHVTVYTMEAALLGCFMISACVFGTLLSHPASQLARRIRSPLARRALMGLMMGLTAITLIYSPWGRTSGAHMNPAITATFLALGKISLADAVFYVAAQFIGGITGVALAWLALRDWLRHASVNYVVTVPGAAGVAAAWLTEAGMSFGIMLMVLLASNSTELAPYTGVLAGLLVTIYIAVAAPISGMSMNPARTLASALPARQWRAIWVYFTAPLIGMLLAASAYAGGPWRGKVYCAKLDHCNRRACIFRCHFHDLRR